MVGIERNWAVVTNERHSKYGRSAVMGRILRTWSEVRGH